MGSETIRNLRYEADYQTSRKEMTRVLKPFDLQALSIFLCIKVALVTDVSCGTGDEEHTVEEWLAEHDHENGEAWFLEWVDALEKIVPLIQFVELFMPDKLVNEVHKVFIRTMYQNYLIRVDFMSQFRENLENLLAFLKKIRQIIEEYKQD